MMCLSVQTATQQPIVNLEMTSSSSAGAHSSNGSCTPLAGSDTGNVDMDSTQSAASSDDSYTESSQQSSSPEHLITSQSSSDFDPLSPELDIDSFLGPEYQPCVPNLLTFRIVGDNIDKNIKPRNMTSEHQTRSLHYFHVYAVRDRIDLSKYNDKTPEPDIARMNFESLLPSSEDAAVLNSNLTVLIGRTLRAHMPFFAKFADGLGRHIMHEYYDHMSTKSEVVSVFMCELKAMCRHSATVTCHSCVHCYSI